MNLKEILKHTKPERNGQFFDARIAAYLLNPLKSSYSYDDIAKEFAGTALPSQEEIFGGKPPRGRGYVPGSSCSLLRPGGMDIPMRQARL